jgi:hypothetical protein
MLVRWVRHFMGYHGQLPSDLQAEGPHEISMEVIDELSRHFDVGIVCIDRLTGARAIWCDDRGGRFRQR